MPPVGATQHPHHGGGDGSAFAPGDAVEIHRSPRIEPLDIGTLQRRRQCCGIRHHGDADIGFQQISELVHESGIQYLGPLPADIQYYTIFSSGIMDAAKQPDAARALQAALSAASVAPVYVKNGMDQAR